jgi:hypothetical protein
LGTKQDRTTVKDEEEEEYMEVEGMGKLVKDLFHSDCTKVDAALDVLVLDLYQDNGKGDIFTFLGGCAALVQLVKRCLKTAMKKVPACDEATELNELVELATQVSTRHHQSDVYARR